MPSLPAIAFSSVLRRFPAARPFVGWMLAGLVFAAVGRAAEPAPPAERPLMVSAAVDSYPYSYRDESGQLDGFAVDLLDVVARRMELKIARVPVRANEDLPRLAAGEFDIGQLLPRVAERFPDVEYSAPVLIQHGAIFVRKGDRRFATMDDLRAKRARVAAPTQGHAYALACGLAPELLHRASSSEGLHLLADGQVDAVLITRLTGLAQMRYFGIRNVEPVGPSLDGFTVRYCLVTHRDNAALLARLNEGLAILYQTGEFERIYQKWFARYEPAGFTRAQVVSYVAGALALALVIALWALVRQRQLHQRITRQAEELAESRTVLAEAQHFAHLGHWRRSSRDTPGSAIWAEETYRIFERDPQAGVPRLDEIIDLAAPPDRERWREAARAVLAQGQPYDLYLSIEPKPGLRKIIHVRGRPTIDATDRATGSFGTVQDITAWRAAEEALRQSEQLLHALYDNLPLALGVVERPADGWRVISLNPEGVRQLGLSVAPPPGRALTALGLAPEWLDYWAGLFARCLDEARPLKVELVRPDQRRAFAITLVPLDHASDRARCCFLMEDVTDRKLQDAEMAQGHRLRAIGELVGGIAHEFNNLLTPIMLNSDLLQSEWAHLPGLRDDLKLIADAAHRSADLTRRLLAFGRKSERDPEWLDLGATVQANLDLLRHTFDHRIRIESSVAADLPPVFLNGGELHQILLNLLVNARDTLTEKLAHPSTANWHAALAIEAVVLAAAAAQPLDPTKEIPPQWIRLTVRDNGCGMPPDVLERIFEPFYTTKPVGQGTGLGLATVWHLIAEFGGRIDVESTVGEGTAVHVCLPVHPRADATTAVSDSAASVASARPRRLLLVEDEEAVSNIVVVILQREGHIVVHTADGLNAWEQLSAAPASFDGVIMDLNMPGLDGLELARRARALPYHGPLVVMSGRITDNERTELAGLDIAAVIEKPFTIETFLDALAPVFPAVRKT